MFRNYSRTREWGGGFKKKQSFKTIRNFVCGIQQGITFFLGKQIRARLNAPDNTSEGLAIYTYLINVSHILVDVIA